jgi:replicative DNA helicase
MTDKLPPQNIEAEEEILGGILLDSHAITRVASILIPDAFYVPAYQQIYQAALDLYAQEKPTDLMTITTWLSDHKLLRKVGGKKKLAQLANCTVSAVNIERYAELVLEKYHRRQLITAANEISELGYDTTTELESVFDQSQEKIFNLTTNKQDRFQPQLIKDCLKSAFNKLEENQSPEYPTGLADLDALIGGLIKQDLIVIAARASMGKTWLACYLANHIALSQKLPVVFFSAEMSSEQLTKRFLAMHSGIDSARLMRNQIYTDEYDSLAKALKVLSELPIIIDDTPASVQNPDRIRSVLRRIQSEHGTLGLVVMDYIQKLGDRAAKNRAQAVGKFSGAFKDIAKEFGVPFVALAQINRGVETQSNKRPTMSDIKDSGDIEQDMDLGLLLYRDEYYNSETKDKGVMEINVAKNRNGSTGVCQMLFEPTVGEFRNMAGEEKLV